VLTGPIRPAVDYVVGYVLWPDLLIIAVAGFFSSRARDSSAYSEMRSA
jgi:hypothetical protein